MAVGFIFGVKISNTVSNQTHSHFNWFRCIWIDICKVLKENRLFYVQNQWIIQKRRLTNWKRKKKLNYNLVYKILFCTFNAKYWFLLNSFGLQNNWCQFAIVRLPSMPNQLFTNQMKKKANQSLSPPMCGSRKIEVYQWLIAAYIVKYTNSHWNVFFIFRAWAAKKVNSAPTLSNMHNGYPNMCNMHNNLNENVK